MGGFRRSALPSLRRWPSVSRAAARWVGSSAFRFGDGRRAVGLRAHGFRFSACTASGLPSASWFFCLPFRRLPLGGLAFGLTASAFRHAPFRGCPRRVRSSAFRFGDCPRRVGLRAHCFRFSARAASEIAARRLAFGLTASAFRHAPHRRLPSAGCFFRLPLRRLPSAGWPSGSLFPLFGTRRFGNCPRRVRSSAGRVGLRAHCFRFSARPASEIALGELALPPSVSELPLGELAFGLTASAFRHAPLRRLPLGGLAFGLTASAFRHAPLRDYPRRVGASARRVGSSAFRFGDCRSAGWPSGSRLPLFGTRRSAPPHRRSEGRRSTPTRHLFHFKTLIPTC